MSELSRDAGVRVGFWVLPQRDAAGEESYVVVGPTGVPLYTFTDVRDAIEEAAELNGRRSEESSGKRRTMSSSLG
jgi:hypothetical protein